MSFEAGVNALAARVAQEFNELPEATPHRQLIHSSGRMYAYTDLRWVTNSDDNYGPGYYQWNESGGAGSDPVVEWEHMGDLLLPGTRVKSFTLAGKTNNSELLDVEVYGLLRKPDPVTRWTTGMDADGEDTVTDLFRGSFRTSGENVHTGASNDFHLQKWNFDVAVTDISMLSLYLKPIGTLAETRYHRMTCVWELEV